MLPVEAVIGIGVGAAVLVIIGVVVAIVFLCCCRSNIIKNERYDTKDTTKLTQLDNTS